MNSEARDLFKTVVAPRGTEESNLEDGTFRLPALHHLESRAASGGVAEAGFG